MRGGGVLLAALVVAVLIYVLTRSDAPKEPGPVRVRQGPYGVALDYQAERAGGGCCG
jgi:hypothetical protein